MILELGSNWVKRETFGASGESHGWEHRAGLIHEQE
jgi:hypothetical protein